MTLSFALNALRRRIVLILVTTLVIGGIGVGAGMLWPKTYTSTAQILLGLDLKGTGIDPQSGNQYLQDRVSTYAALVNADDVVAPVAQQFGISENVLRKRIAVSIVPSTVVLDISVTGTSPDEAVALTNAVSRRYEKQVSSLNVATGGPKVLPAQLASPQPPTDPDQLHGPLLIGVSLIAGLVIGVLLALLLGLRDASREHPRRASSEDSGPVATESATTGTAAAGATATGPVDSGPADSASRPAAVSESGSSGAAAEVNDEATSDDA